MAQGQDWLPPTMHMDLVCGQILAENEALGPVLHEGDQYYFCSSRCQSHFLRSSRTPLKSKKTKAVILSFPVPPVEDALPNPTMQANAF
ncbi:hypothetical protein D3C72_128150 [compost metagenome]